MSFWGKYAKQTVQAIARALKLILYFDLYHVFSLTKLNFCYFFPYNNIKDMMMMMTMIMTVIKLTEYLLHTTSCAKLSHALFHLIISLNEETHIEKIRNIKKM